MEWASSWRSTEAKSRSAAISPRSHRALSGRSGSTWGKYPTARFQVRRATIRSQLGCARTGMPRMRNRVTLPLIGVSPGQHSAGLGRGRGAGPSGPAVVAPGRWPRRRRFSQAASGRTSRWSGPSTAAPARKSGMPGMTGSSVPITPATSRVTPRVVRTVFFTLRAHAWKAMPVRAMAAQALDPLAPWTDAC